MFVTLACLFLWYESRVHEFQGSVRVRHGHVDASTRGGAPRSPRASGGMRASSIRVALGYLLAATTKDSCVFTGILLALKLATSDRHA